MADNDDDDDDNADAAEKRKREIAYLWVETNHRCLWGKSVSVRFSSDMELARDRGYRYNKRVWEDEVDMRSLWLVVSFWMMILSLYKRSRLLTRLGNRKTVDESSQQNLLCNIRKSRVVQGLTSKFPVRHDGRWWWRPLVQSEIKVWVLLTGRTRMAIKTRSWVGDVVSLFPSILPSTSFIFLFLFFGMFEG